MDSNQEWEDGGDKWRQGGEGEGDEKGAADCAELIMSGDGIKKEKKKINIKRYIIRLSQVYSSVIYNFINKTSWKLFTCIYFINNNLRSLE